MKVKAAIAIEKAKPLIIDCDTGGLTEHFALNVKTMERLGISAEIIEDKKGLKKNSKSEIYSVVYESSIMWNLCP